MPILFSRACASSNDSILEFVCASLSEILATSLDVKPEYGKEANDSNTATIAIETMTVAFLAVRLVAGTGQVLLTEQGA